MKDMGDSVQSSMENCLKNALIWDQNWKHLSSRKMCKGGWNAVES